LHGNWLLKFQKTDVIDNAANSQALVEESKKPAPSIKLKNNQENDGGVVKTAAKLVPEIILKNCQENSGGVVKTTAIECFTEDFDLNIHQGRMTEERKVELLAKIQKIVDGEITTFAGVENDIRVIKDS